MERGTIRTFVLGGIRYGLKVVGGWDSWYRFKTPDGRRFRSIKAALAHLQEQAANSIRTRVLALGTAWHCKVVA